MNNHRFLKRVSRIKDIGAEDFPHSPQRQVRRWLPMIRRSLWAAVFAVGVGLMWWYVTGTIRTPEQHAVHTRRLVLVDPNGQERARTIRQPDGTLELILWGQKREEMARVKLDADGMPDVALRNQHGKELGWLVLLPDETPSLVLCDKKGRERAWLVILPNGSTDLLLRDQDEIDRVFLELDANGTLSWLPLNTEGQPSGTGLHDEKRFRQLTGPDSVWDKHRGVIPASLAR